MFSDLTLIDSQDFWDMVEKSQPEVSRQFDDEEKRGPKRCAKALHQEITRKNQQVRQLQRNRESPEVTKMSKMKKKKGNLARKLTERAMQRGLVW